MCIVEIKLNKTIAKNRSKEVKYEQKRAIADILNSNQFQSFDIDAPYSLTLSIENRHICFCLNSTKDNATKTIEISLTPFRRLIKDYFIICENYYKTLKNGSYLNIEAIDMGRKALHDEAGELLKNRLTKQNISLDLQTARRLFTLICVLHIRVIY